MNADPNCLEPYRQVNVQKNDGNFWDTHHNGMALRAWSNAMDVRTKVRELDEVITRTRSATARELKLARALPACSLRRRIERRVRLMRDRLQRLQTLRNAVYRARRPAVMLR